MRRSVYIQGFSHGNNPVPAASVIDRWLMTGAGFGTDRFTGEVPEPLPLLLPRPEDRVEVE